jgi:DNA invertase Pin-like site-specific DNA recombinase
VERRKNRRDVRSLRVSGVEFAKRRGLMQLLNVLKPRARPFDVLVMAEGSRLGRESIETSYVLKQIVQAGVRVFFYLTDTERTLDGPTDKITLAPSTFADEIERAKAQERVRDKHGAKFRDGHVVGGVIFGYRNEPVLGPSGKRSHVMRVIEPEQAAVVVRIFERYAAGEGLVRIAKTLNAEGAPSPRAHEHRPLGGAHRRCAAFSSASCIAASRRGTARRSVTSGASRSRPRGPSPNGSRASCPSCASSMARRGQRCRPASPVGAVRSTPPPDRAPLCAVTSNRRIS